jgi:hypothetical protein
LCGTTAFNLAQIESFVKRFFMAVICAIPYDYDAADFYFSSSEEYYRNYDAHLPVEEYELEFIDGADFEGFLAEKFFKKSNDVEKYFDLIEKYEASITQENLVALEYLFEYNHITMEDALEQMYDVMVFEGTAEEYAIEIYEHEIEGKLGKLSYYFDYKALGREFILNGDVYEYRRKGKDYIITS